MEGDWLMLIYCFMYLPLFVGVLCFVFVLLCITLCHFLFCNHIDEEDRAGWFAFIVFWIFCYCKCPVAHPHGAVSWSVPSVTQTVASISEGCMRKMKDHQIFCHFCITYNRCEFCLLVPFARVFLHKCVFK